MLAVGLPHWLPSHPAKKKVLFRAVVEFGNAHRPAERSAVAVILILGLRAAGRVLEEGGRVQRGVDHVFVQFAVILVGAALGDGIQNRTGGVAHGGIETGSLHLEFGDGVLRQLESDQRIAASVEEGVGHAIDGVFVGVKRVAVGGELRRGAVEAALALTEIGRIDHARRQQHELVRIARLQRKIFDLALFDDLTEGDVRGLDQRRAARDFDALGGVAHLEPEFDGEHVIDAHGDIGAAGLLKSSELGGEVVDAGKQVRKRVAAGIIRAGAEDGAGLFADSSHFGSRRAPRRWNRRHGR